MICPSCGAEYRDGFDMCADCGIPLIRKFPDRAGAGETALPKLVTVLQTGNHAVLAVAKALLDGAGLRYLVKNETLSNLWGMGSFGTGFNPLTGPITILVDEEDALTARQVLEELEEPESGAGEGEPGTD